ncbi:hypothetical protein OPV22_032138 [Ensete ventricosum]|uniref:Uncharacterized protein n=1 Tax=Ensete ventricosum TaxID=4639 RepID=A0AAV8PM87_ENSVE|nr:hypothetical protein OPV22_032138 [Ensete ventricosum]
MKRGGERMDDELIFGTQRPLPLLTIISRDAASKHQSNHRVGFPVGSRMNLWMLHKASESFIASGNNGASYGFFLASTVFKIIHLPKVSELNEKEAAGGIDRDAVILTLDSKAEAEAIKWRSFHRMDPEVEPNL